MVRAVAPTESVVAMANAVTIVAEGSVVVKTRLAVEGCAAHQVNVVRASAVRAVNVATIFAVMVSAVVSTAAHLN